MGSRIKSLFWRRSSNNTTTPTTIPTTTTTKGTPYDSAVALDPPVRGSYPVAGNGPNVLRKHVQHSRATTLSGRGQQPTSASVQDIERPKTAPNGRRLAAHTFPADAIERTRSGFSMKTAPNFSDAIPRISQPTTESARLLPPHATPKRVVQVYQPKRGIHSTAPSISSSTYTRSESNDHPRGFVDVLDAHSKINPSRDVSRTRIQASGLRNYGEDVADRNISLVGEHDKETAARNSRRLDLNSPELSYLKSLYNSRKAALTMDENDSRAASPLGHILGDDSASDDIKPRLMHHSGPTGSRAPVTEPSNTGPAVLSHTTKEKNDDGPATLEKPERTFSLISTSTASERHKSLQPSTRTAPATRSRARTLKEPPPVPPPSEFPRFTVQKTVDASEVKQQRRHTMSAATPSSVKRDATDKSIRPSTASRAADAPVPQPAQPKSNNMIVKDAKKPPNLKGVVDLTKSVDTDVTTKPLPAVTHEHITRDQREISQEVITREIHYHDVYHRILPVIDTEILPTKHYFKQGDGSLIEIPESSVIPHEPTWKIETIGPQVASNPKISEDSEASAEAPVIGFSRNSRRKSTPNLQSRSSATTLSPPSTTYGDDGADGPVVPLARSDGQRRPSTAISSKKSLEPILTSKKQYTTTDEGYPRTEYVWYHPPLFEDIHGRTQPATIGTGLPDLTSFSSSTYANPRYSSDDDLSDYSAPRTAKDEEDLLFRDSGYGSGMLPGLHEKSPMANLSTYSNRGSKSVRGKGAVSKTEPIKLGRVIDKDQWTESSSTEGEATKFLKRLRELKSSSVPKHHAKTTKMNDVQKGVSGLSLRN